MSDEFGFSGQDPRWLRKAPPGQSSRSQLVNFTPLDTGVTYSAQHVDAYMPKAGAGNSILYGGGGQETKTDGLFERRIGGYTEDGLELYAADRKASDDAYLRFGGDPLHGLHQQNLPVRDLMAMRDPHTAVETFDRNQAGTGADYLAGDFQHQQFVTPGKKVERRAKTHVPGSVPRETVASSTPGYRPKANFTVPKQYQDATWRPMDRRGVEFNQAHMDAYSNRHEPQKFAVAGDWLRGDPAVYHGTKQSENLTPWQLKAGAQVLNTADAVKLGLPYGAGENPLLSRPVVGASGVGQYAQPVLPGAGAGGAAMQRAAAGGAVPGGRAAPGAASSTTPLYTSAFQDAKNLFSPAASRPMNAAGPSNKSNYPFWVPGGASVEARRPDVGIFDEALNAKALEYLARADGAGMASISLQDRLQTVQAQNMIIKTLNVLPLEFDDLDALHPKNLERLKHAPYPTMANDHMAVAWMERGHVTRRGVFDDRMDHEGDDYGSVAEGDPVLQQALDAITSNKGHFGPARLDHTHPKLYSHVNPYLHARPITTDGRLKTAPIRNEQLENIIARCESELMEIEHNIPLVPQFVETYKYGDTEGFRLGDTESLFHGVHGDPAAEDSRLRWLSPSTGRMRAGSTDGLLQELKEDDAKNLGVVRGKNEDRMGYTLRKLDKRRFATPDDAEMDEAFPQFLEAIELGKTTLEEQAEVYKDKENEAFQYWRSNEGGAEGGGNGKGEAAGSGSQSPGSKLASGSSKLGSASSGTKGSGKGQKGKDGARTGGPLTTSMKSFTSEKDGRQIIDGSLVDGREIGASQRRATRDFVKRAEGSAKFDDLTGMDVIGLANSNYLKGLDNKTKGRIFGHSQSLGDRGGMGWRDLLPDKRDQDLDRLEGELTKSIWNTSLQANDPDRVPDAVPDDARDIIPKSKRAFAAFLERFWQLAITTNYHMELRIDVMKKIISLESRYETLTREELELLDVNKPEEVFAFFESDNHTGQRTRARHFQNLGKRPRRNLEEEHVSVAAMDYNDIMSEKQDIEAKLKDLMEQNDNLFALEKNERKLMEQDMREMLHQTLIWWDTLRQRILAKEGENAKFLESEVRRLRNAFDDYASHEARFRQEYSSYLRDRSGIVKDLEHLLGLCTVREAATIRKETRMVRQKTHLLEILLDALDEIRALRMMYFNLEHFSKLPDYWKGHANENEGLQDPVVGGGFYNTTVDQLIRHYKPWEKERVKHLRPKDAPFVSAGQEVSQRVIKDLQEIRRGPDRGREADRYKSDRENLGRQIGDLAELFYNMQHRILSEDYDIAKCAYKAGLQAAKALPLLDTPIPPSGNGIKKEQKALIELLDAYEQVEHLYSRDPAVSQNFPKVLKCRLECLRRAYDCTTGAVYDVDSSVPLHVRAMTRGAAEQGEPVLGPDGKRIPGDIGTEGHWKAKVDEEQDWSASKNPYLQQLAKARPRSPPPKDIRWGGEVVRPKPPDAKPKPPKSARRKAWPSHRFNGDQGFDFDVLSSDAEIKISNSTPRDRGGGGGSTSSESSEGDTPAQRPPPGKLKNVNFNRGGARSGASKSSRGPGSSKKPKSKGPTTANVISGAPKTKKVKSSALSSTSAAGGSGSRGSPGSPVGLYGGSGGGGSSGDSKPVSQAFPGVMESSIQRTSQMVTRGADSSGKRSSDGTAASEQSKLSYVPRPPPEESGGGTIPDVERSSAAASRSAGSSTAKKKVVSLSSGDSDDDSDSS